ncbi:hypothetical protein B0H16DRAFT_1378425 [Mycena metata]|uniref:AAA+ ATPase domain-containing protein n=1 Tax=Mycena metata TaxID=1033252 RepID=A0AAD7IDW1_9AGAR|nr:hypothetical protein B0H16DRAFT_1378425 [Mycena metata]
MTRHVSPSLSDSTAMPSRVLSSSGRPTPGTFQPFKASLSSSSRKSDRLSPLIMAAEAATASGEFALFPYIKSAFGTFVTLLKVVENVRRNRENLQELCEKIKEIVDILGAQIAANGATVAVKLKDVCEEFERFLQEILVAVTRMQAETKGFRGQIKGFTKSSSISVEIAGYEKRIQELILNINQITEAGANSRAKKIEATLHAVRAMISPNPLAVQVPLNTNNCPTATRIFEGREKILVEMKEFFESNTPQQHIYVLHGPGGAGKTQIALKFIQDSIHFTNTFFVDASTIETINIGFKNIARLQNAGNSSDNALKWLMARHEQWLLFFDNADDSRLNLNKFLPQCNHGNIVITTRNPELQVYGASSYVFDMEKDEAVALLLKSAAQESSPINKKDAIGIVKTLWHLPLAIVQAGAFIAKSGTLDRYLALYSQTREKLLKEQSTQSYSDYEWPIYTTCQMSFDRLSASAIIFLQLCSFLHQEGISEDIFSRAADYKFSSLGPSREELEQPLEFLSQFRGPRGEWDTLAFLEITNEIMTYSLATFAPGQSTFSIHPLVQQWSQRNILGDPEPVYCIIHSILGMSIQGIPKQHLELASLKLLPHLDAVMQFQGYKAPNFTSNYELLYAWANRHQEAKVLKISAIERQRALKRDDDLDILSLMHSPAATYNDLGQAQEAQELEVVGVEKQRAILGEDHPHTLTAMYNLAAIYKQLGQIKRAEELEAIVMEKRRAILGEDHPQTLTAMHNLAATYKQLGQAKKAEELEVLLVEKQRDILGPDHPDTLLAMHNLAATYLNLGRFEDAARLQTEVTQKFRIILGDNHPDAVLSIGH